MRQIVYFCFIRKRRGLGISKSCLWLWLLCVPCFLAPNTAYSECDAVKGLDSLLVVGSNYSIPTRPQVFLSWSAPALIGWTNTIIERATADSIWNVTAIRPAGVQCLLDENVEWDTEYRYRITVTSPGGSNTVGYSVPVTADKVAFLDLHDYYLPRRWRTHVYLVTENKMTSGNVVTSNHVIQYRFIADRQNESGGSEETYEVVRRTDQGDPDTSYVRFITEFTDRILFYSDSLLTQFGVPSIWEQRYVAAPSWKPFPDSIRYLSLADVGMTTPDTLQLFFSLTGGRYWSNCVFRRDFGLVEGFIDSAVVLNQTHMHNFTIQLASPLGAARIDDPPRLDHPVIWPNPARTGGDITVRLPELTNGTVTLSIHDVLGRTISRKRLPQTIGATSYTIETRGMAPGIYILTVQDAAATYQGNLLLQ